MPISFWLNKADKGSIVDLELSLRLVVDAVRTDPPTS